MMRHNAHFTAPLSYNFAAMKNLVIPADLPLSPPVRGNADLARRVFGGALLRFAATPSSRRLMRRGRALARRVFEHPAPWRAHEKYRRDEFLRRADIAQREFNTAPYKNLFAAALQEAGVNPDSVYWDTLGLRIAPPRAAYRGGFRSQVAAHRDTWGAGIEQQINWWSTLWPLSRRRTLGFFPAYWTRPLPNDTAKWSFADYLASRRQAAKGDAAAYPSAPRALDSPQQPPQAVVVAPAELLCFSSAHLHASIDNHTAHTRFSWEIRTVDWQDIRARRAPPNVDCESKPPLWGLFSAIADGGKLRDKVRELDS